MADVTLDVVVSGKVNIAVYKMRFKDQDVPMQNDRGQIVLSEGSEAWLKWWMIGEPAGSMKVQVLRANGNAVATRQASTIPNTKPAGYDRLKVKLPAQS